MVAGSVLQIISTPPQIYIDSAHSCVRTRYHSSKIKYVYDRKVDGEDGWILH